MRVSELVTGEAVALELRPARLPSRALALLVDLLVTATVYVTVTVLMVASTSSLDAATEAAIAVASFVLLLVGGPIAVETLSHGRSLGKLACGLRVVRDDGGPIRFRHALVRGAVGVVEILLTVGTLACAASLVSARGRRVGDVLAGTLVVRERVPTGKAGLVPPPPPWLAGRFSGLDLSGVPDGLWLAVRQYLMRMQQLDPQVGQSMAARLAADVAARTGAPAPVGVPPAAYLAAVVHERQSRDAGRALSTTGGAPGGPVGSVGSVAGAWGARPAARSDASWPAASSGWPAAAAARPVAGEQQLSEERSASGERSASEGRSVPGEQPSRGERQVPAEQDGAGRPVDGRGGEGTGRGAGGSRAATGFVPPA